MSKEKIVSIFVFISTLLVLWLRTRNLNAVWLFGVAEIILFIIIWFSDIIAEYLGPLLGFWAIFARDFPSNNVHGNSLALKLIGWILVISVFLLSFCVRVNA